MKTHTKYLFLFLTLIFSTALLPGSLYAQDETHEALPVRIKIDIRLFRPDPQKAQIITPIYIPENKYRVKFEFEEALRWRGATLTFNDDHPERIVIWRAHRGDEYNKIDYAEFIPFSEHKNIQAETAEIQDNYLVIDPMDIRTDKNSTEAENPNKVSAFHVLLLIVSGFLFILLFIVWIADDCDCDWYAITSIAFGALFLYLLLPL